MSGPASKVEGHEENIAMGPVIGALVRKRQDSQRGPRLVQCPGPAPFNMVAISHMWLLSTSSAQPAWLRG